MVTWTPTIRLISKTASAPTGITTGGLTDGDLTPFFNSMSITNVGVRQSNHGLINLDIPQDGRFIRSTPVLVDENTKNNYLVELQITQGANSTKLLRAELGKPEVKIDEHGAEVLQIPCKGIEFIPKDNLQSREDLFATPKTRMTNLITAFSITSGVDATKLTQGTLDIPDTENSKQNWSPSGATTLSQLMEEVIIRLEEPPSAGGTLKDYFYDFTPSLTFTRTVTVDAEEFGNTDSGVILNPITVNAGAEDEEFATTDNEVFKNVVIAKGSSGTGSLPTDFQRFASKYNHGIFRLVWDGGTSYVIGDLVRYNDTLTGTIRFFTAKTIHSGTNPVLGLTGDWIEDFTTIPSWDVTALYGVDETVYFDVGGSTLFYKSNKEVEGGSSPNINTTDWDEIIGAGVLAVDHVDYFSYTPWTVNKLDFEKNIPVFDNPPLGNYIGAFVDMNVARTLFDRVTRDDYNARVSVKYVQGAATVEPPSSARYDGVKFLIGDYTLTDASLPVSSSDPWFRANWGKLATWVGGPTAGDWVLRCLNLSLCPDKH